MVSTEPAGVCTWAQARAAGIDVDAEDYYSTSGLRKRTPTATQQQLPPAPQLDIQTAVKANAWSALKAAFAPFTAASSQQQPLQQIHIGTVDQGTQLLPHPATSSSHSSSRSNGSSSSGSSNGSTSNGDMSDSASSRGAGHISTPHEQRLQQLESSLQHLLRSFQHSQEKVQQEAALREQQALFQQQQQQHATAIQQQQQQHSDQQRRLELQLQQQAAALQRQQQQQEEALQRQQQRYLEQ